MPAPTRAELLAAADASDDEAGRLEVQAAALREQARVLRGLAGKASTVESVLTSKDTPSTLDDVNATPSSDALRSKKQLDANPSHPFVALLKRQGLTVNEVAQALTLKLRRTVHRNTVQSWYKKTGADGFRRIPMDVAEAMEALYALPVDSWPRRAPRKK